MSLKLHEKKKPIKAKLKSSHSPGPVVELVGIYTENLTFGDKELFGTFHIFLVDKGMDIRGGKIFKNAEHDYFIRMPHGIGWDEDTQHLVSFPTICFMDEAYDRAFKKACIGVVLEDLRKIDPDARLRKKKIGLIKEKTIT